MVAGDEVFVKGKILGERQYIDDETGIQGTEFKVALYNICDEMDLGRILWCKPGEIFKRIGEKDD